MPYSIFQNIKLFIPYEHISKNISIGIIFYYFDYYFPSVCEINPMGKDIKENSTSYILWME